MTKLRMTGRIGRCAMRSLLLDWREQLSWGRFCALVALGVAVAGQWTGMDAEHLKIWLGVAVGNYLASKLTEAVCSRFPKYGPSAPDAEVNASAQIAASSPTGGE